MPFDARFQRPGFLGSISVARPVRGLALAATCFLLAAASGPQDVQAQQTVVIGGGGPAPSGIYGGAPANTIGRGGSGIEVNSSVLDSLGPGPAGALPLPAPQAPVYGAGTGTPGVAGQAAGGAYRLPGTGELVVTRPSTLLYPPLQQPQSRLAVPMPRSASKQQATVGSVTGSPIMPGGKLKSRLISEPPKQPLKKQDPIQPEPKAKPAMAAKKPAAPKVAAPAAPAKPKAMTSAPAMPSLTEEVRESAAPAAPKAEAANPPVSASIARAPKPEVAAAPKPKAVAVPAPSQRTATVSPPPAPTQITPSPAAPSVPAPSVAAPSVTAPSVTAPSVAAPGGSAPKEVQSASRTTGASSGTVESSGGKMRLTFAPGSAELSDDAKRELQGLAKSLVQNASSRVQLLAYAADGGEGASRARRMSLSRALAVRAFLIDQGVRSNRMDVRAQGRKVGDGPADRVDILAR